MSSQFKKKTYYENTAIIFSPYGIVKHGTIMISEKWKQVLVYDIGNCGLDSMFKIVPKPKDKTAKKLKPV